MPTIRADWRYLLKDWAAICDSGMFTEGQFTSKLEEAVTNWCGLHAVAVSSAGAGLFAMMRCKFDLAGVWPRSVAAVSNNTFFATGAMAQEAGFRVAVLDCNSDDWTLSVEALQAMNPLPALVLLTHVGGALSQNYAEIAKWCQTRGVVLMEDAAHVFGVEEAGGTAGSLSAGAVFSFYPTKAIPAGEGGMIVTSDALFAERLRRFRNYGKYKEDGVVKYTGVGFNLRMDEWTAAVAYEQVQVMAVILASRRAEAESLRRTIMPALPWCLHDSNWYKYPVWRADAERLGITRFAGKIYASSDQLATSMGRGGLFPTSQWVSDSHVCLPLEEGLYTGKSDAEVLAWLRGEEA